MIQLFLSTNHFIILSTSCPFKSIWQILSNDPDFIPGSLHLSTWSQHSNRFVDLFRKYCYGNNMKIDRNSPIHHILVLYLKQLVHLLGKWKANWVQLQSISQTRIDDLWSFLCVAKNRYSKHCMNMVSWIEMLLHYVFVMLRI